MAEPSRQDSLNLLLSAIAFEKLSLSHLLNAEGEKLQSVLGTLPGQNPSVPPTVDELLAINQSIVETLEATVKQELTLQGELEAILFPAEPPIAEVHYADFGFDGAFTELGGTVPLNAIFSRRGNHISLTPPSPDILLAPNRTYQVIYTFEGVPEIGFGLEADLLLNQASVDGGEAVNSMTSNPLFDQATGVVILRTTGDMPSKLQVRNRSAEKVTRVRMIIVQLS